MSTDSTDPLESETAEQEVDKRYPDDQESGEDVIATNSPEPDPEHPDAMPQDEPEG